jgi:broad specificity phosphatase PhoE
MTNPGGRLILVRHAESEGNAQKIMQGAGEYPLSEKGRNAATQAASRISLLNPAIVVSSDLARATDTARLAAGRVDIIDPRLRERGAGPWEGRPRHELEDAHPGSLEDDSLRPEGFEPAAEVLERMLAACSDLLDKGVVVVAFTHGAVLRVLDVAAGGTGRRFAHLEGLELVANGPNVRALRRHDFNKEENR